MRREEIEHIETYNSLTNHIEDLQKLKSQDIYMVNENDEGYDQMPFIN